MMGKTLSIEKLIHVFVKNLHIYTSGILIKFYGRASGKQNGNKHFKNRLLNI